MKRSIVLLPTLALVAALLLVGAAGSGQVARGIRPTIAPEIQERLLDGLADFELSPTGDAKATSKLKNYVSSKNDGCGLKDANNVKVNQNCLNVTDTDLQGRGQAQNETSIAIDPLNRTISSRASTTIAVATATATGPTASTAARAGATRPPDVLHPRCALRRGA